MTVRTVFSFKRNLPCGWLLQVLDFAENHTCVQQDEIQSAHWYHEMVTIHSIVLYFQCSLCQKVVKRGDHLNFK